MVISLGIYLISTYIISIIMIIFDFMGYGKFVPYTKSQVFVLFTLSPILLPVFILLFIFKT